MASRDDIEIMMFRAMHDAIQTCRESVYYYLCMKTRVVWEAVLGFCNATNDDSEADFRSKMRKLENRKNIH
jgi:hypothetical protein